jgi:hypothetical protein
MLGTILFIDEGTGTAIVRADDGKRYRFPAADWLASTALNVGLRVDFDTDGDQAVGPLPVTDAVAAALATPAPATSVAPPVAAPEPEPAPAEESAAPEPVSEPVIETVSEPMAEPVAEPVAEPAPAPDIAAEAPPPVPAPAPEPRPISPASDAPPAYAGLSTPTPAQGNKPILLIIGGIVLLLTLLALAYMMWDNAAGSGDDAAEVSGDTVTLYAQEDVPVRNVASMTNSTVLGRIARGDRVTGVEVPGSSDPSSRWLQLNSGNRYVPMTGLGPNAPSATPDPTPLPDPTVQPQVPPIGADPNGSSGGDYNADPSAPPPIVPAPPPVRPLPIPPRPVPRPAPPPRPQPIPQPLPYDPGGDPRDTPPVG